MTSKLDELLDLVEVRRPGADQVTYRTVIDAVFTIGPKVHGGTVQMIVARAARMALTEFDPAEFDPAGDVPAGEKLPVAISSDYLASLAAGEVDIAVTVCKRGRTVTVLTVDVRQGGRTAVASSVTCARLDTGASRHTAPTPLDHVPAQPPASARWLEDSPAAEINHLGPALDMALDPETMPMVRRAHGDPLVRGWVRPKGEPSSAEFAILVGDLSFPVVMNLGLAGWAPTVQLTAYVRRHPAAGWLRFAASSTEVGAGMFEEDHVVVDSTGAVVVQTRQLALIPQSVGQSETATPAAEETPAVDTAERQHS